MAETIGKCNVYQAFDWGRSGGCEKARTERVFLKWHPKPPLSRWERIEVRVIPLIPAFSRKGRRSFANTL